MKKLFVSVVGTRDWQCKHMAFDTIFDFVDYCKLYSPHKSDLIGEYNIEDLCRIMSDSLVTFHYCWQK
jgi:hypothetical protein